jgi:hypothetical protein
MLLWPLEWFFIDLYVFQAAGADSAIFLGVWLPLTIHVQQSTNILFPVLKEASNIYGKNMQRPLLVDNIIGLLLTLNNLPQNHVFSALSSRL